MDFDPVWSFDGASVVYVSERPVFDLYTRPADGSGPSRPFVTSPYDKFPGTFSPDGNELVFEQSTLPFSQIWRVKPDGKDAAMVLAGERALSNPALSPDGKWLALESSESGSREIIVVSYPDVSRSRRTMSTGGGRGPNWTKGGRELIWRSGSRVVSATFNPATGEASSPQALFEGDYRDVQYAGNAWDVSADGQHFLFLKRPLHRSPRRIHLVTNWVQRLPDKVGPKR
jgi:serine/threonine-protein kinase